MRQLTNQLIKERGLELREDFEFARNKKYLYPINEGYVLVNFTGKSYVVLVRTVEELERQLSI